MSGNGTSAADKISYNSKVCSFRIICISIFCINRIFCCSDLSEPEQIGRLNPVFIAAISGTLALGGTLVSQLWGNKSR